MRLGLVFASLLCAQSASAKVLDIYAQVQTGGGTGKGFAGAQKDADFFKASTGLVYGGLIGAELLWIDAWIEHNQYANFEDQPPTGTWTQFMAGSDWDFPLSDPPKDKPKEDPKWYGEVGFAIGFGVGTGQQVVPPLSNDEISDKGFLGQIHLAGEYRFNQMISLGLTFPVTYGYMFKNGIANDESNQYQSVNAMALLSLRLHWHVK